MKKASLFIIPFFLASCSASLDLVHELPASHELMKLEHDVVSRTADKTLDKIEDCLKDPEAEDFVVSPASYLLAVSGLSAVSTNFNNAAFGLNDAGNDVKDLLTAWNFEYKKTGLYDKCDTCFKSVVLHQQVGQRYRFSERKRQEVSDKYISTMVSDHQSFKKDADSFFKDKLGMKLESPDLDLSGDAVLTYGALKMEDYVPNGLSESDREFKFKGVMRNVKSYAFGSQSFPTTLYHAKGKDYDVFSVDIHYTDLMIVLPKEGVDVNGIDISEAYTNFIKNAKYVSAYGYVPYFHNKTTNLELTETIKESETGNEIYFDKLLDDNVINDISILKVLQSSDFEFNKDGVSGESITMIEGAKSSGPGEELPIDLRVNRPFYAISMMNDFPLFVNKVSNPGLDK